MAIPIFCSNCGCRIGWGDDGFGDVESQVYFCDGCKKEIEEK